MDGDTIREKEVSFTRKYTLTERRCAECSTPFMGWKLRKYCSDRCAWRAAWRRNGPRYIEKQRSGRKDGTSDAETR